MNKFIYILLSVFTGIICVHCSGEKLEKQTAESRTVSEEFKAYWFDNSAEITSYTLEQARYGETHKGSAVLIYVSEPFNKELQVKADSDKTDNIPVLKLITTRKFNTGIYPYLMMTSTFSNIGQKEHALKITSSSQDWCGQTFFQLNNKEKFIIEQRSYFEKDGDKTVELPKNFLEDELWTLLKMSPNDLPIGEIKIIPSFAFLRLNQAKIEAYDAIANNEIINGNGIYTLSYVSLKRKLTIFYSNYFPYSINGWEEETEGGQGNEALVLSTKARKNKEIKIDYWNKKSIADSTFRTQLGLD